MSARSTDAKHRSTASGGGIAAGGRGHEEIGGAMGSIPAIQPHTPGTPAPRIIAASPNSRAPRGRTTRTILLLAALYSAFCILILPARAVGPATQPTSRPATRPVVEFPAGSPIRTWFKQLDDPDPQARVQAQIGLMGMSARDLPAFRQLVADSRPLAPTQVMALHAIVEQVYLAALPYPSENGEADASGSQTKYFLGITSDPADLYNSRLGIPVVQRWPGFPAFRYLRDGDMILGIYLNKSLPLWESPNAETHILDTLTTALQRPETTPEVVLEVLRDGEEIRVPVHLVPHPIVKTVDAMAAFLGPRLQRAESYWNQNFQPLVDHQVVVQAD